MIVVVKQFVFLDKIRAIFVLFYRQNAFYCRVAKQGKNNVEKWRGNAGKQKNCTER